MKIPFYLEQLDLTVHICMLVNHYTHKFLKWPLPALILDVSTVANGATAKNKNQNSKGLSKSRLICTYAVCKGICFGLQG